MIPFYLNKTSTFYYRSRCVYRLSTLALSVLMASCGGGNGSNDQAQSSTPSPIATQTQAPEIVIDHEPAVLEVALECDENVSVGLNTDMDAAIVLAESRYMDLLERIETSNQKYIDYTGTNGTWELENSTRWTSGFLPGILWYLYGLTQTESWRTEAETSTAGLRALARATDNDTGFQIYGSYGIGREILGGTWSDADLALDEAASTLIAQRYNPNVGAFRAWPQEEGDPFQITNSSPFEVNVDMIMNLEAVLSAAEKSGDITQVNAAISHADITWQNVIRPDFSSYHVAGFNVDGELSYNRTHQGWLDESTWSRGQSWAVYGYAMLYRYTELPRMLERAEKTYQYFKQATQAQASRWIPYADFDAPIDVRNPLDTSAVAIVASAALELYGITGNTLYLSDANDMLEELIQDYLSEGSNFDSILLSASEQYVREDDDRTPDAAGYEVGASFGDFYFLESLYRLKNAAAPVCD